MKKMIQKLDNFESEEEITITKNHIELLEFYLKHKFELKQQSQFKL